LHDGGVDGWGIEWTEGHDNITVLLKIGSVKCSLLLMRAVDSDLMITGFGVETNEKEAAAFPIVEDVKSIVAARDGVQEGVGDAIQWAEIDTPSPNEVVDVVNVLLVGLGWKVFFEETGATEKGADVFVL